MGGRVGRETRSGKGSLGDGEGRSLPLWALRVMHAVWDDQ